MASLDELLNGVSIPNPNYNPKTKTGRLQSPTIPINDASQTLAARQVAAMSRNLSGISYNLNEYLQDDFAEYDVFVNPHSTREELEKERARNQSGIEQLGNSVVQTVGNEIVLGIARGFSDLVDLGYNAVAAGVAKVNGENYNNDYTNVVSSEIEDLQETIRKEFPIYQEDPNAQLDITSWSYLMSRLPSVATTVSLMVPGLTVTKGVSALSTLSKGTRAAKMLSKGYNKTINKLGELGKKYNSPTLANTYALDRAIGTGAEQIGTAFIMRSGENYMEAREAYKSTYDETLKTLANMSAKDRERFYAENPEYAKLDDKAIATDLAGRTADKTFMAGYPLMLLDVFQLKALKDIWKPIANRTSTGGIMQAQRESLEILSGTATTKTAKDKILNKVKDRFGRFNTVAAAELSEGFEEGYQYAVSQMSQDKARNILNPNYKERDLSDYLTDEQMLDSVLWGWLGGMMFQAAGSGLGKLSKKLRDKNELSEEELIKQNIANRKVILDKFVNTLNDLDKGIPVGVDITDVKNFDPITGELKNKLTDEEIAVEKEKLARSFAVELGIGAIKNGTFDLTKEYINNPIINKYLQEQTGMDVAAASQVSSLINNTFDKLENTYSKYVYRLNNLNKEDPYIVSAVAENNTRLEFILDDYKTTVNQLETEIQKELADFDIEDTGELYEHYRRLITDTTVKKINEEIAKIEKDFNDKKIDKVAKDISIAKYQKQLDELYKTVVPDYNGDVSLYEAEINKTLHDLRFDNIYKTNKALSDKIARKIVLENDMNNLDKSLARTDADFNKQYNDYDKALHNRLNEKNQEAVSTIQSLMEKYNEDNIYNYVVNDNPIKDIAIEDLDKLNEAKKIFDLTNLEDAEEAYKTLSISRTAAKAIKRKQNTVTTTIDDKTVSTDKTETKVVVGDATETEVAETAEPDKTDSTQPPVEEPATTTEEPTTVITVGEEEIADNLTEKEVKKIFANDDKDLEEFNNSFPIVANKLLLRKLKENRTRFLNDSATILTEVAAELESAGVGTAEDRDRLANLYKVLAKRATKKASSFSSISGTTTTEQIKLFDEIVEEYAKAKPNIKTKTGKYYIDLFDFFDYLTSNEDGTIDYELAYDIFNNIKSLLNQSKFIVKNKRAYRNADNFINKFINQDIIETPDTTSINVQLEGRVANVTDYNKVFNELEYGSELELRIVTTKEGKQFINISKNGTKLAVLVPGRKLSNGTGYTITNYGININITKVNNEYNNNFLDPIYNMLFDTETNEFKDLFYLLVDINNGENVKESTEELFKNKEFVDHLTKFDVNIRNQGELYKVINFIKPIIFFEKAQTVDNYLTSYNNWKQKQYENIETTNKIVNDLSNKRDKVYRISQINKGTIQLTNEVKPFNSDNVEYIDKDFNGVSDNIQLGYVDTTDGIIKFNGGDEVSQEFGFSIGSVVAKIKRGTTTPSYVRLIGNTLDTQTTDEKNPHYQITKDITAVLTDVISRRLNGNASFEELYETIHDLFGNRNDTYRTQLFNDLLVVRQTTANNDGFAIFNKAGKRIFAAYKYRNKTNTESTAIIMNDGTNDNIISKNTLVQNKTTRNISNKDKEKLIANSVANIISDITFSQSFQYLATLSKETTDKKFNKYVEIKDGKFVVTINNNTYTYNNYFDYVVKTNAYQSRLNKVNNSNYVEAFEDEDGYTTHTGSLAIKSYDVEKGIISDKVDKLKAISDKIKQVRRNKSDNKGEETLIALGLNTETIDKLRDIYMIPENVSYDARLNAYGKTTNKGIVLGKQFIDEAPNQPIANGVRTLMHERIHQLLLQGNRISIKNSFDELADIKQEFADWLDKQDDATKAQLSIFKFDEQFINSLPKNSRQYYIDNPNLLLEEFFIEAITNPILANKLNEIQSSKPVAKIENPTLLQRIIDFLLNLISNIKVKDNTLLDRIRNLRDNTPTDIVIPITDNTPPPVEEPQVEQETAAEETIIEEETIVYDEPVPEEVKFTNDDYKDSIISDDDLGNLFGDEDYDDSGETLSSIGGTPIQHNTYAGVTDLLRYTDLTNEAEIDRFLATGLINFSC